MDELNEIENALLKNVPTDESYWKPKFDRIRSLMISPELKKAMYDIIFEMMDHEPWDRPFDELQKC